MSDEIENGLGELVSEIVGGGSEQPVVSVDDGHFDDDIAAYEQHQEQIDPTADDPDKVQREVPLGALKEERHRRQQMQQQVAQLEAQSRALQVQYEQFMQQQAAAEAQIPAFEEDPAGYVQAREQQFRAELEALKQSGRDAQVQAQAAQLQSRVVQESARLVPEISRVEAAFMEKVGEEEYRAAFATVEADVLNQLRARAPGATQAELALLGRLAAMQFLDGCSQNGVNPCEHIYSKAQQLGWRPGARGVPAKSGRATSKITLQDVGAMSDAEFDDFFAQMKRGSVARPAV